MPAGAAAAAPGEHWRLARPERCPVGTCYLHGAVLPCLPNCWHCRSAARHGCAPARETEIRPCPVCGHLPEPVEDPGELPRLVRGEDDGRVAGCLSCGGPVEWARQKFCSAECYNRWRRGAGEERGGLSPAASPRTYRLHLDAEGA